MSAIPTDVRASFALAELERIRLLGEDLKALCLRSCRAFLPNRADAAPIIANRLIGFIRDGVPISLLRVGDGEGNALGLTGARVHPVQLESFNARFFSQNGTVLSEEEACAFCHTLRSALVSADIIGFRSFGKWELNQLPDRIERGRIRAALGVLYARELLTDELSRGGYRGKILTNPWVHLDLIPYLSQIMNVASDVVVISGRSELQGQFEKRLGRRLRSFFSVPPQGYRPACEDESHHRSVFPRILDALRTDLRGTLVLVGAGFFGKIYCQAAKNSGAIAVDLGSAFDVLAGLHTRPVHSKLEISSLRWT